MPPKLRPPRNPHRLSRFVAAKGPITDPITANFDHLLPVPARWKDSWPSVDAVPVRDRIKYWNVVPGDQVRVAGVTPVIVREVLSVNKFTNEVFLKTAVSQEELEKGKEGGTPIHYSKLQLYLGEHEIRNRKTGALELTDVFAKRVGRQSVRWNWKKKCWTWERHAVATIPSLPPAVAEDGTKEPLRINIPWPVTTPPDPPRPGLYDTAPEVAKEQTYSLPDFLIAYFDKSQQPFSANLPGAPTLAPLPRPIPSEHAYLKTTLAPPKRPPPTDQPFELYLSPELSNPHSRRRKQQRWQARLRARKLLLRAFTQQELERRLVDGLHRSKSDARQDAFWRWRFRVEETRQAEAKRRWRNRGGETRLLRKIQKKTKKATRIETRMRNLVLEAAPNQVVPKPIIPKVVIPHSVKPSSGATAHL